MSGIHWFIPGSCPNRDRYRCGGVNTIHPFEDNCVANFALTVLALNWKSWTLMVNLVAKPASVTAAQRARSSNFFMM